MDMLMQIIKYSFFTLQQVFNKKIGILNLYLSSIYNHKYLIHFMNIIFLITIKNIENTLI